MNLRVSNAPHLRDKTSTAVIMRDVVIALIPAMLAAIYFFGIMTLVTTAVTVIACMLFEWLCNRVMKRPDSLSDWSAVVTGILLSFNCPPNIPVYIPIIGAFFAIVVIKMAFGGLGANFLNPALGARVILNASFPAQMNTFTWKTGNHLATLLSSDDMVSQATPLGMYRYVYKPAADAARAAAQAASTVVDTASSATGEVATTLADAASGATAAAATTAAKVADAASSATGAAATTAAKVADAASGATGATATTAAKVADAASSATAAAATTAAKVADAASSATGAAATSAADAASSASGAAESTANTVAQAPADFRNYLNLFLGYKPGVIGEICVLALVIGLVYLLIRGVIDPIIPVVYCGSTMLFCLAFGFDPVYQLLSGGLVLGAIFMATDYVTSPTATAGKILFALGCGILTGLFRIFGGAHEGVSFAILLMNILTPHIDSLTVVRPRRKALAVAARKGA